jgi:hypothetical protein
MWPPATWIGVERQGDFGRRGAELAGAVAATVCPAASAWTVIVASPLAPSRVNVSPS